ncbi:TPA: LTA synthase family protein [Campylobacter jejuni]
MRKVLLQIIIFSLFFVMIFTFNRFLMQNAFIPSGLISDKKEFALMYSLGAFHDIRFLSAAFLPLLLCGFLAFVFCNIKNKKIIDTGRKFYIVFSSFYIAIISLLCVIFSFIKYYYYEIYKTKIDIFIFGLENDNTQGILNIIMQDYPVFKILAIVFFVLLLSIFINIKILNLKLKTIKLNKMQLLSLMVLLLIVYTIALRGPFRRVIMNNNNYAISEIPVINHIAVNPLMAMKWAFENYKNQQDISHLDIISEQKYETLKHELFDFNRVSVENKSAQEIKPSVALILMESFGLNLGSFANSEHNFLGALKKHFDQDFVFTRFLSSSNNTIPSFSNLFFISPIAELSMSKYQNIKLDLTPLQIYKKAGYKIYFVTSGNGAWKNLANYLYGQGVDKIIDENTLIDEYDGAFLSKNTYGVADEFLYKKIYELLQKNPHKTLIIALTISNHPPYKIPQNDLPKLQNIPQALLDLLPYDKNKQDNIIKAYTYANNEFGKFLDKVKQSPFKNSVIIAATGDHRVREMSIDLNSQKAFAYSVPFYLYIPKDLQNNIYYDKDRVGSHKDIFPTLYALSLNNVKYLSVGGRNMLTRPSDEKLEFGINDAVWIDKNGVYSGAKGYYFENNNTSKDTNHAFELDEYHKNFTQFYKELNLYQLSQRLGISK